MTSEEEDKNIPRGKDIEKLKSKLLPSSTADPSSNNTEKKKSSGKGKNIERLKEKLLPSSTSNSTSDIQKDTEVTDEPDDPYVSCGFSAGLCARLS